MKDLYVIDGHEGSSGKSLIAGLIYHLALESGRTCYGMDSDAGQGTFQAQYGAHGVHRHPIKNDHDVTTVMTMITDWMTDPSATANTMVLDVGASQAQRVIDGLRKSGIATDRAKSYIRVHYVWVLTADKKSVAALKSIYPSARTLLLNWTIIRNLRDGPTNIWSGSDLRAEMRKDMPDLGEISIPEFEGKRDWLLEAKAMPWTWLDGGEAVAELGFGEVGYLVDWRDQTFDAIRKSGLIG
jgi:hypothetical protein